MIYELNNPDYEKVRPLFHPLAWHLTSAAVLDGNNPGRVFVDDPANPQTAFMFSPEGCYLAGNPDNEAFNHALNHAIYAGEVPGERVSALFFVYHPESWEVRLAALLDPRPPIRMLRRHYVCREVKYDWRANLPDGFAVHRINQALLNQAGLRIPAHMHNWMGNNWGSTAGFLERGFGFVTIHDARQCHGRWRTASVGTPARSASAQRRLSGGGGWRRSPSQQPWSMPCPTGS